MTEPSSWLQSVESLFPGLGEEEREKRIDEEFGEGPGSLLPPEQMRRIAKSIKEKERVKALGRAWAKDPKGRTAAPFVLGLWARCEELAGGAFHFARDRVLESEKAIRLTWSAPVDGSEQGMSIINVGNEPLEATEFMLLTHAYQTLCTARGVGSYALTPEQALAAKNEPR